MFEREDGDQLLTVKEAAKLYPVGICRLYSIVREDGCPFALHIGKKKVLIKKKAFEEFLYSSYSL